MHTRMASPCTGIELVPVLGGVRWIERDVVGDQVDSELSSSTLVPVQRAVQSKRAEAVVVEGNRSLQLLGTRTEFGSQDVCCNKNGVNI